MIESRTLMDDPATNPHTLDELLEGLAAPDDHGAAAPRLRGRVRLAQGRLRATSSSASPGFVHDGHSLRGRRRAPRRGRARGQARASPSVGRPAGRRRRPPARARRRPRPAPRATRAPALQVVGITGTNGKTTTAYLLDSILRAAGRTTGLDRHRRDADRRGAPARGPHDARVRGPAGAARRDGRGRSATPRSWRSRRTRSTCTGSTRSGSPSPRSRTSRRTTWTTTATSRSTSTSSAGSSRSSVRGSAVVYIDDEAGSSLAAELKAAGAIPVLTVGRDPAADVRASDETPRPAVHDVHAARRRRVRRGGRSRSRARST